MADRMVSVTGAIPADQRAAVLAIGGDVGLAHGLRVVISAGLRSLGSADCPAMLATIDDVDRLAARLAAICGRRTPSGAWWAPSDAAMPAAELLELGGDVIASPGRVVLASPGCGALLVDLNTDRIEIQAGEVNRAADLDLLAVANQATLILPALAGLSAGPGSRHLGSGLQIVRLETDEYVIGLQDVGIVVNGRIAWRFAAELTAMAARRIDQSAEIREALNQQLEMSQ
jgi:hypothetical protein